MNNNTVPTHSVVDPKAGSKTPPCWLQWKTNHFLYKIIYIYIVEWQNSMGIYSSNSCPATPTLRQKLSKNFLPEEEGSCTERLPIKFNFHYRLVKNSISF